MDILNLVKYTWEPYKVRVKYVFVGFYILLLATVVSVAVAGNFDCNSNENDAERMVCSNQTLSALDTELSEVFKQTIRFSSRETEYVRMLRKQLDDCNANISCIIDVYEATIFRYSSPKIPTRSLMTGSNNECKIGEVFDNCKGTFTWTDGTEYSGNWRSGKRHGLGKQLSPNGDIIIGYWEKGFLNGKVKIKFSSGKYFLGSMKGGNYSGDATIYDKGMKYKGVFVDLDGSSIFRGIQYLFDGTKFTGNFKNLLEVLDDNIIKNNERIVASNLADCAPNVFHNCYGTYTWDTGEKYVGEWLNRMRVGEGTFTYRNGNKYTGSWKNNVPDGQGSLSEPDGKVYVGQWIDGRLQENRREGEERQAERASLETAKDKLLNYVFSKKWEISGLPCDINGGAYQVFSPKLKVGWNMAAGGQMLKETSNNVRFSFEVLDAKTFRHVVTVYGNDLVTRAIGRPDVRVSYTVDQYTLIDKSTMRRERLNHQEINFDLMLKGFYREEKGSEWGKVSTINACG